MNYIINENNFSKCIEFVKDIDIYIKDFKNECSKIVDSSDFDFHIKNNFSTNLSFLKIDKCVYNDSDDEKCDFGFANEKVIFFVEIKELEDFGNHAKKNKKRKKAKSQLINSINSFKIKFPEMDLLNVFPVIALKPKIEEGYINLISTKDQSTIDEFIEKCGCPNIFEGNYIEFK